MTITIPIPTHQNILYDLVIHINELGNMLKEPTHIQAHLVFADTQSPNKKPKELEFCQRSTEMINEIETIKKK
jgi:hypothetical protein